MLFLFGRSIPSSVSSYFSKRAKQDGHQVAFASMGEFPDEEPFADLRKVDVKGQLCVMFQSVVRAGGFNPSSNYMQILALADNAKRLNGAKAVWAVTPMGGFMRQDHAGKKEGSKWSILSHLSGRLMKEAGIDGMSTLEAHSTKAMSHYEQGLGAGNVLNINPNPAFVKGMDRLGIKTEAVANPDGGSDSRSENFANLAGITKRIGMDKERHDDSTEVKGFHGSVVSSTTLIDDIAGTLGTAADGIKLLYDQGSKNNILVISHPVMAGSAWKKLHDLFEGGQLDKAIFLPTFARDSEMEAFAGLYGPEFAEKVIFLEDEYNEMLYDHVTQTVAQHPVMQMEPAS